MKTIRLKWFSILLLACTTFLFPACEGSTNNPDEYPEGVITVKLRSYKDLSFRIDLKSGPSENNDTYTACLTMNLANNFSIWDNHGQICDTGKKSLGAVKTIPTAGWASEVAVFPQHTYVIRIGGEYNYKNYAYQYYKLYVVDYMLDTTGGIIGAEVQYCEWNPAQ